MRIVYIYRASRPGGHSIENVFAVIAGELRAHGIEVIEYKLKPGWNSASDVIQLWKLKADVYHVTGDVNYFVAFLPRNKSVLTIHDIGHYLFGLSGWRKLMYKWLWLVLPLRLARQLTVVSEATKIALETYLSVDPRKLVVVGDCYDPKFFPRPGTPVTQRPRVLQVGTGKHKNVPRLVQALEGTDCVLDLIGRMNADIKSALYRTRLSFENTFDISQDDLIDHYAVADIVSFISISEGFGMPIVEAQAMGKPLITSNRSPMAEVAGSGACLVDPTDISSIRAGIKKLIHDHTFRMQVVDSGLKNVERYSPQVVATKYLSVYRQFAQLGQK